MQKVTLQFLIMVENSKVILIMVAIGKPMNDMDKIYWFLCGLDPSFETFSNAIFTLRHSPLFRDMLSHSENHEIFLQSIHGLVAPPTAFISQQSPFINIMGLVFKIFSRWRYSR